MVLFTTFLMGLSLAQPAKDENASTPDAVPAAALEVDLLDMDRSASLDQIGTVELFVLKGRNAIRPGRSTRALKSGDRFRLALTPKRTGHVYMFHDAASGERTLIHPRPVPAGNAAGKPNDVPASGVTAEKAIEIPTAPAYIAVKPPFGGEKLVMLFTDKPLDETQVRGLVTEEEFYAETKASMRKEAKGKGEQAAGREKGEARKRGAGEDAREGALEGPTLPEGKLIEFHLRTTQGE